MQIEDNNKQYQEFLMELGKKGLMYKGSTDTNWGNVPCQSWMLEGLYDIYEPGMNLIDLGCGAGNILNYAKNIGYEVLGVDWDRDILKELEKTHSFIHKDITELDKAFWNSKDIVYCYMPVKSNFKSLLHRISRSMKPGAYLVTPEWEQDRKGFTRVSRFIIRKDLKQVN